MSIWCESTTPRRERRRGQDGNRSHGRVSTEWIHSWLMRGAATSLPDIQSTADSVVCMGAWCTSDVHSNVHSDVHGEPNLGSNTRLAREASPTDFPAQRACDDPRGHNCGHRQKESPNVGARTVKVGAAEGGTCAHRALTVRTGPTDTMDLAGPPGPAWKRLSLSPAAGLNRASPLRGLPGSRRGWPCMEHANV